MSVVPHSTTAFEFQRRVELTLVPTTPNRLQSVREALSGLVALAGATFVVAVALTFLVVHVLLGS